VRVDAAAELQKMFWGGGSVALATSADDFHVLKCRPSERLEDGTVNFLDIAALHHGFALLKDLGGIRKIQVGAPGGNLRGVSLVPGLPPPPVRRPAAGSGRLPVAWLNPRLAPTRRPRKP
jgi:selenocysteine lyase/cysteine desulfurase